MIALNRDGTLNHASVADWVDRVNREGNLARARPVKRTPSYTPIPVSR